MDRAADAADCGADAIWAGDPHVAAVRTPPCRGTAPPALIVSSAQTAASRTAGPASARYSHAVRPRVRPLNGTGRQQLVRGVRRLVHRQLVHWPRIRPSPPRVRVRPPLGRYTRTVTEGHSPDTERDDLRRCGYSERSYASVEWFSGLERPLRSLPRSPRRHRSLRDGHGVLQRLAGRPAASWSRNSRLARGRKAEVGPPTCGVMSAPGACQSGWPGRQRLRVGDVERGTQPARCSSASRDFGVHHSPARDVDEQCSVLHPGEEARAHEAPGLLGERGAEDHHVGARQQFGQARERRAPARGGRCVRCGRPAAPPRPRRG